MRAMNCEGLSPRHNSVFFRQPCASDAAGVAGGFRDWRYDGAQPHDVAPRSRLPDSGMPAHAAQYAAAPPVGAFHPRRPRLAPAPPSSQELTEMSVYIRAREGLERLTEARQREETQAANRIQQWFRHQCLARQAIRGRPDPQFLSLPNCENEPRQQLLKLFWACCENDEPRACKRQLARVCGSMREVANTFRMPLEIPVTPYTGTRDALDAVFGGHDASSSQPITWSEFSALVTSRTYTAIVRDGLALPDMEAIWQSVRRAFDKGGACSDSNGAADRTKLAKVCATSPELVRIMGFPLELPPTPEEGLRDTFETILSSICTGNAPREHITWDEFWNCYLSFSREKLWLPLNTESAAAGRAFCVPLTQPKPYAREQVAPSWAVGAGAGQEQRHQQPAPVSRPAIGDASRECKRDVACGLGKREPQELDPIGVQSQLREGRHEHACVDSTFQDCSREPLPPEFKEAIDAVIADSESFWHRQARDFAETGLFNAVRNAKAAVEEAKTKQAVAALERREKELEMEASAVEGEHYGAPTPEDNDVGSMSDELEIFGHLPCGEGDEHKTDVCPGCSNVFLSDANFCRVCGKARPTRGRGRANTGVTEDLPDISAMRFGGQLPNSLPLAQLQDMFEDEAWTSQTSDRPDKHLMTTAGSDSDTSTGLENYRRAKQSLASHASIASSAGNDAGLAHLLDGITIRGRPVGSSWTSRRSSKTSNSAVTNGIESRRSSKEHSQLHLPRIRPGDIAVDEVKVNVHNRQRDFAAYRALIDEALQTIAKIKSALYNADRSGAGAELLVQDARMMLNMLLRGVIHEAARGQKIVQAHYELTPEATFCLKQTITVLDTLVSQHLAYLRDEQHTELAKLEILRERVRASQEHLDDIEAHAADRTGTRAVAGRSGSEAAVPSSGPAMSGRAPPPPHASAAGFSLEDARGVLRAFATVLQPRLMALAAADPQRRTPSEDVALKFLTAFTSEGRPRARSPL